MPLVLPLLPIFWADFDGITAPSASATAPNLVVSPGSRDQLISTIQQPGPIRIEVEELGTDKVILQALEAKGNAVEIITPPSGAKPAVLSELATAGVRVKTINSIYMHAKMIVGGNVAFIGSENFTTTSLQYNREIGILLTAPDDIKVLSKTFDTDWLSAK